MKILSRNEMKKVMGGVEELTEAGGGCGGQGYAQANIRWNDGILIPSSNWCSNSVGACSNHGGFDFCVCF